MNYELNRIFESIYQQMWGRVAPICPLTNTKCMKKVTASLEIEAKTSKGEEELDRILKESEIENLSEEDDDLKLTSMIISTE